MGTCLALNRIGVAYYKRRKVRKSLKFHMKHAEYSGKEEVWAAWYNIGMCERIIKHYDKAL